MTHAFFAPILAFAVTKLGRPDGIDTSSLRDVLIGGGPATAQQISDLRELLPGTNVMMGYGMTEVCGITTTFKTNVRKQILLSAKHPNSSGIALPTFKIKVLFAFGFSITRFSTLLIF